MTIGAVKSLSEMVLDAKRALAAAHDKVSGLRGAVEALHEGFGKVDTLTNDIKAVTAQLHDVVGQVSNSPPVEEEPPPQSQAHIPAKDMG